MSPARWLRDSPLEDRLLHIDAVEGWFRDLHVRDLPGLLAREDLLVVNDAATLPASLAGVREDGSAAELRLLEAPVDGLARAVLFGPGDWHARTEDRLAPAPARVGEQLRFAHELTARIIELDATHPRLVRVHLAPDGEALWPALYLAGAPIQYSHLARRLPLWAPQTAYASRPWSVEMPSAGRPLRWELLLALRHRGVRIVRVTHAAGLSSTGDAALDAALPLEERFEIPRETVEAIASARARGGRVVAVGTTVVRALESAALGGELHAGEGIASLRIGPGFRPKVVEGLFTGMHEPTASHFALLHAFAPAALLREAQAHAEATGYLGHEFGDSALILPVKAP